MDKIKLKKYLISISIAVNILLAFILFTPITEWLHRPLILVGALKKSEVIVILSSGAYSNGVLGLETIYRLKKGMELYKRGWADKIICTGGVIIRPDNKNIAHLMKEHLVYYGVPFADVLLQDKSTNTYEDIKFLFNKFKKVFDFNHALFVTSCYHTFRVKKILNKMGLKARIISAVPYQLYPIHYTERLDLFRQVVREYLAICYFKIKGYI